VITIVDYNMCNLFSVKKAFQRIGINACITNKKKKIKDAEKLILPGVGHFSKAMESLKNLDLVEIIRYKTMSNKTPILGICLGMQLLTNYSDEGRVEGLGLVNLDVKKFKSNNLKTPHIGWNSITVNKGFDLFKGLTNQDLFYFVHSYHVQKRINEDIVFGFTNYEYEFVSAFCQNNIMGVQFHPEKSHDQGLKLLKNFCYI